MKKIQKNFAKKICDWGISNNREMPWKGEKNPYLIWISEIILQQTRVEQGLKYFLAFKKNYPTVFDLAQAEEREVLKLWEGLGYYSRARNLHFTAKYIVNELKGEFPKTYEDLLKLKGVGSYTAAAIASFAYEIPKAVVDGNVIRVLSRYYGIENAFVSAQEKRDFQGFADEIIQTQKPAVYNQAIMDFGAKICTPKQVDCSKCFLTTHCFAYRNDKQLDLPLTKKKVKVKERFFSYFIIKFENEVLIEERSSKDIWKGLFQFPMIERETKLLTTKAEIKKEVEKTLKISDFEIAEISKIYVQKLTHRKINANFIEIRLQKPTKDRFLKTDINFLSNFAFPKIINVYLSTKQEK